MSVTEEAAAAFLELHSRLESLEDSVQGSVQSGTSGVLTRLALIEQLVNTSGNLSEGRETRRSNVAWSTGCSDIPILGGEYEEYEDWQYKVRIFLNSECSLSRFSSFLESVDWESDMQDVQDCATSEDFSGPPADVPWMNQQLFNVLAQKTRGNPFQTVKNMSEEEGCYGAGAWVKLLRAYKGKNASRSQRPTGRVHDIKRVQSYSEDPTRMEMWEAALKEHVKDTGCEVADITVANCLRRVVLRDLSPDLQKMSHIVRDSDVRKYFLDQVGLRLCHDQKRPKSDPNDVKPMDRSLAEHYNGDETGETSGNDESDLHALKGKGKGKGFKGQCFHCGQYGHRVAECRKKDIDMMTRNGKNKGFGKGKNPPQQQMLFGIGTSGYGNDWTWNDPGANSWKGKSVVHSVEEQYGWQSGDGTTLFGLEVRTPTIEKVQNKGRGGGRGEAGLCRVTMFSA